MQPGFLKAPNVIDWLGGVVPAWTALEFDSLRRLRRKPEEPDCAVQLSETATSPMARNALIFLSRLQGGVKLTATGNLQRAFVASMVETLEWPGFDPEHAFRLHKVINEPDYLRLHALRIFCDRAKLVRVSKGELRLTKIAQAIVETSNIGKLNRLLFIGCFWNTNLAYFDGYPLAGWPEGDIGLSLWSLSVAATTWQTPSTLARLCTIPVNGILDGPRDLGGSIFEARILRQLGWFDLLDVETIPDEEFRFVKKHRFRTSPRFNDFVTFTVDIERPPSAFH
ncbi:MAG: hypothetical protein ACYCZY_12130 [Lacisediminihabitans sp.]